jgi:hypothetical protein
MHRQPEHVIQFMFAEMGTTGSVDGSARLVIKGRFQQKQIEHVLRRYIGELDFRRRRDRTLTGARACSGVRDMQDMQEPRHTLDKGEPHLLHVVRVVRFAAVCERDQEWFPGASWAPAEDGGLSVRGMCIVRLPQSCMGSCVSNAICRAMPGRRIRSSKV